LKEERRSGLIKVNSTVSNGACQAQCSATSEMTFAWVLFQNCNIYILQNKHKNTRIVLLMRF